MNKLEKKKMCIVGSEEFSTYLKESNIDNNGNIGDNENLYYYYKDGKLGCSDNKPSRHKEVSLTKFIKILTS